MSNHLSIRVRISQDESLVFDQTFDSMPITIGRSNHCQICLTQYHWISRQHAVIYPENNRLYLVDLKSVNGIQMGGKTYDRVEIHNGTSVQIGLLIFKFELEQGNLQFRQGFNPQSASALFMGQADDETPLPGHPQPNGSNSPPPLNARKGRFYPELGSTNATEDGMDMVSHPPDKTMVTMDSDATLIDHQNASSVTDRTPFNTKPSYLQPNEKLKKATQVSEPTFSSSLKKEARPSHSHNSHRKQEKKKPTGLPLGRDRFIEGIERVARNRRVIESYITWHDDVFDTQLFWPGEQIIIGRTSDGVYLPTLKGEYMVALFDGEMARCSIPPHVKGTLRTGNYEPVSLTDLIKSQSLQKKGNHYILKLGATDLCTLEIGIGIKLHMRYAPAPRQLVRKRMIEPDSILKRTVTGSSIFHFLLLVVFFLIGSKHEIKKMEEPTRFAKIIVKKEEPKKPEPPPPPPPPPPEEKKVVPPEPKPEPKPPKKMPKPKIAKKPPVKKKIVEVPKNKKTKVVKQNTTNNKPPTKNATENVPSPKPAPDVNQVGALAALGALGASTPNPNQQPVAINVNQNAGGGGAKMSTNGVIGALKANGGRLTSAGIEGVKTQGRGFGSGNGYGVQGINGTAGTRGVGGSVVGTPTLMNIKRTEGLTRQQVMSVVKGYLAEIQQCYEKSLLVDPGIAGRVEYEWHITPQGQVEWAKVKKSDIRGGDSLNSCVISLFKKMKFPVAKNGESTQPNIGFPFGRL